MVLMVILLICRFILFGFIMLSGLVSTYFTPETKERTLEDISGEVQEKFISGPPVEEELSEYAHLGREGHAY